MEYNNGLWVSGTVWSCDTAVNTLWHQYQKWVHMPTLTKHWYCNHSSLTSPCNSSPMDTRQIPAVKSASSLWEILCMWRYTDAMAAKAALVTEGTVNLLLLPEQWFRLHLLPRLPSSLVATHTMCQVTILIACLHPDILRPVERRSNHWLHFLSLQPGTAVKQLPTMNLFCIFVLRLLLRFYFVSWQWSCPMLTDSVVHHHREEECSVDLNCMYNQD